MTRPIFFCARFFHSHAMQFADRLNNVETSAIRELFKLLGKPGIISLARHHQLCRWLP